MFGFGGWLNRLGWELDGEGWIDYGDVDEAMEDHREDTGCPGDEVDWFDEYPDSYYCHHCGVEL